jgi:hypothetical protein
MFSIGQIAVSILVAFLISILTSWATVYFALKQFYSERWWDRKNEAYTNIINALSDLVSSYEAYYDEGLGVTKLSDERRQEINELSKKGHATLKRATNIGAFVISKNAELALKKYWREPEEKHDPNDWFWVIEHDYEKAEIALKELVECARKDLRV